MAERPDDMMHGGVFDREPRHCVARVATSGGCLAASSGRHASGRPGESSARARRCCCATATRVRSWSSARQDETVRRTVRGERPFIMSFAAPPPSSSAPKAHAHPPVSPATERDTAAEASADARGVLKVRPHPPRPHRSPTRHPIIIIIVGKEKNARRAFNTRLEAFRLTPFPIRETKKNVLRSPFVAPRSSTRRSREATWAPRGRSPRTSTSSRSGRTPTPRGTGCGSTSAFQTRGPARRFFST